MVIGENIRNIRLKKGITQSDLANLSGIRLNQISKIERGESDPKSSTIIKIAKALECDMNSIFFDEKNMNESEKIKFVIKKIEEFEKRDQIIIMEIIENFRIKNLIKKIERLKNSENIMNILGEENIDKKEKEKIKSGEKVKMEYELEKKLN